MISDPFRPFFGLFAPNLARMTTDATDTNGESDDNVRVVVRVRPFNNGEVDAGYREIAHVDPIHGTIKYGERVMQ